MKKYNYWKLTQPAPWHRILLDEPILSLLANKCYAFYLFLLVQITAHYQNLTQITLIHSHIQKMEAYSSIILVPV